MIAPTLLAQLIARTEAVNAELNKQNETLIKYINTLEREHNRWRKSAIDAENLNLMRYFEIENARTTIFILSDEIKELKRLLDIERSNHCATFKQLEAELKR